MSAFPHSMSELAADWRTKQQSRIDELCALQAACVISTMNPHTREDFIAYLKDLNDAQAAGDDAACQYVLGAIVELFHHHEPSEFQNAPTLPEWERSLGATADGREAIAREDASREAFLVRYLRLKEMAGLRTQQDVADAADLSPTTVRAIESGRTRPHFRTLSKLAAAFGVRVEDLWNTAH